jgi:hypothetical protein
MFTINATKAISECLLGNMFEGKEIEINHLILHIKQNFKSTKLSKEDYSTIFEILEGYKAETQIKEENFDFIVHTISEFIKSRLLVKGVEFFARGDQEKAYEYFETGVNFSISKSPFIDPSDENLILKLKELSFPSGKIMKSSISLINNSLIYKGYKYGDLIMVVAPPKVGKTTLLCQEGSFSAKNGLKVVHICLGDMDNIDVVCKYTSVLTNEPMEVITEDPIKYFNEYPVVKETFKNVRISCFPAGELGVRELLGHLRQLKRKFNFDMAIVDYDSNICLTGDTIIMTEYGERTLEDLYLKGEKNFKVYSYNEKDCKIEQSAANRVELTKEVTKIQELELENGEIIRCTPDHKFLTKNRGWVEAKDLNEEDDLVHISGNQLGAFKRWQDNKYREKISNSMKNKKHSVLVKEKISNSMKGNTNNKKDKT